eukprot:GHVN01076247.1.p1 GENE.GHVN01076247.1~~GHVN01076247.1.p1  ORF type:complete len:260 (+),score=46.08 GHVN01076247.1:492-1271(+)
MVRSIETARHQLKLSVRRSFEKFNSLCIDETRTATSPRSAVKYKQRMLIGFNGDEGDGQYPSPCCRPFVMPSHLKNALHVLPTCLHANECAHYQSNGPGGENSDHEEGLRHTHSEIHSALFDMTSSTSTRPKCALQQIEQRKYANPFFGSNEPHNDTTEMAVQTPNPRCDLGSFGLQPQHQKSTHNHHFPKDQLHSCDHYTSPKFGCDHHRSVRAQRPFPSNGGGVFPVGFEMNSNNYEMKDYEATLDGKWGSYKLFEK